MDSIGSRLRSARERANLSQEALARLLDVSSKTVFRIEHGEYEPSIALVRQIATAVDGDADFILTGRPAPANDTGAPNEAA